MLIVRRVEALGKFLDTDDGKNLLAGYQARDQHPAHRGEEGRPSYVGAPDPQFYSPGRRRGRWRTPIDAASAEASAAVAKEDFAQRDERDGEAAPHVDAFFDKVTVNVADG